MNITIIAFKKDMAYVFYMKHNTEAIEWKLNKLIDQNKKLIIKLSKNWFYPLNKNLKVIVFD